jgi:hypothetical protein
MHAQPELLEPLEPELPLDEEPELRLDDRLLGTRLLVPLLCGVAELL